jgi:hypothetical protein
MSRSCGSCSLCCKLMDVPEVKSRHAWCPHAKPGSGCKIYADRPAPCRRFHCEWLRNTTFGEHWYPNKAKIVISTKDDPSLVMFIVDPAYPLRWREEPWLSDIKHIAANGHTGVTGKHWTTVVVIKDLQIPIVRGAALLRAAG